MKNPLPKKQPFYPAIGKHVFIDPSAQVIGQVEIGDHASIWPGCVIRADINKIVIGKYSNIQDLSVLHVESNKACLIGNYVVVGHRAILHACTIGDESLIGMGAIIMDGAEIGAGTIIGAGSLVTQGEKLQPGSMYFGSPAKFVRRLKKDEIKGIKSWAVRYARYANDHLDGKYGRILPVSDDISVITRQSGQPEIYSGAVNSF